MEENKIDSLPGAPKPGEKIKVQPVDLRGAMQYMLTFDESGKFTARYELDVKTQLVALMIVNDTFKSALRAEADRPKNQRYHAEERKRMKNATVQMDKMVAELANYLHTEESKKVGKPKIELFKP